MPRKTAARRGVVGRALVSLAVLAASVYLLLTITPRLGLDLRGGTQIVLETKDSPTVAADAQATDRTVEAVRRRVDALGVAEPLLARSGENRIVVELPGVQDPAEAVEVIGRTAQLSFHPVLGAGSSGGGQTLPDESGQPLRLGPAALGGDGIEEARGVTNAGIWVVAVEFSGPAARAWEGLTARAACEPPGDPLRRIAIVLDGKVISSPQVNPDAACRVGMIGDRIQITGHFTQDEARELGLLISAGALPVPVEIIEQRTVGPTLGTAAIEDSARAAVIGVTLTAVFLLVVYWLSGAIAVLALLCYATISYAALLAIGATLTLPGLAGFVLAIGMAVDATVLVFERTREEYTGSLPPAVDRGYGGALSAIVDSNVTTLLAAALLFWLASGPVRGFGVTLTIGVLASMFTSLVLTRVLLHLAARFTPPGPSGLTRAGRVRRWVNRCDPGFLSRPRAWLLGSGVAVVLGVLGLVVVGPNLGVEFTGGRVLEYTVPAGTDAELVRAQVADAGFPTAIVRSSGDTAVTVRTEPVDQAASERIRDAVATAAGSADSLRDEQIGPSLGAELRAKALIALGVAVLAQLVYLAIRFDWRLGLATVTALAQDVLLVLGAFAWLGRTMDGVFLAALLTVIGYSVNDTVVVFDRVRELRARGEPFARTVGRAILQTLPRTVNTGIGVLFVLAALLILGDGSLADFALAMILGLIIGTTSTVTTAGPVAIILDKQYPRTQPIRRPPTRTRTDSGAVV